MYYPDKTRLDFDLWLLQSVMLAGVDGDATPARITDAAGLLSKNHLPEIELRAGLSRLTQAGFIAAADGAYAVTPAFPDGLRWSERDRLKELLAAPPGPDDAPAKKPGLMQKYADRLQKSTDAYVKRAQKYVSDLSAPPKKD